MLSSDLNCKRCMLYNNKYIFITKARLAQLVERKALNLVVVGSSPTMGVSFFYFNFFTYF
jgi:hypothetical protein